MRDLAWFIITGILFALLGLLFIMLGRQIWKKQRIDLIISFHSDKVSAENKQAYCTLTGTGVLIMGIGFLLSGICTAFTQSVLVFVPMTAGLVSGLILLISTNRKYSK